MAKIGAYIITAANGCRYVGSTSDYTQRRLNHLADLRLNRHYSTALQQGFNDNPNLSWEFIEAPDRAAAYKLEGELLNKYWSDPGLSNDRKNPKGPDFGHTLGAVHTEETKALMSKVRTGQIKTPEWSDKIADSRRIAVEVDGVVYRSATEAAAAHNTSPTTVLNRVNNPNPKYAGWKAV